MSKKLLYYLVFLFSIQIYPQGEIGDTVTKNNIKYIITSNAPYEVQVLGKTNSSTNIEIPENITHKNTSYQITSIGKDAFFKTKLQSVIIPNSVTYIGDYAFANNYLTQLTLPNSLTSVGKHVFSNNELTNVTIAKNLTEIGYHMFSYNNLSSVVIPNGVTNISEYAFYENSLTNLEISNSVKYIYWEAFAYNNLTSITIPNSIASINREAFIENPLSEIKSEAITPPTITGSDPIQWGSPFGDKSNIDLIIPEGTSNDYTKSGWVGFKSVTEVDENGTPLSIHNPILNEAFKLYVNSEYATLKTTTRTLKLNSYTIYNITGSSVLKGKGGNEVVNKIPITQLEKGIYIIMLTFNEGITTKKFIK